MKKDDRKIFLYALLMSAAVLVIIVVAYMSEMKIDSVEDSYEKIITEQSQKAENVSKELQLLQEENVRLNTELNELKNKKAETISSGETYNQATKLLSDIYLLIESGDIEKARKELEKFDTSTFDDTIINYKKALQKLIE